MQNVVRTIAVERLARHFANDVTFRARHLTKKNVQNPVMFIVVHDAWRLHPLAWIHRSEARQIAWELRRNGHAVRRSSFVVSAIAASGDDRRILRLSDPVMFKAVEALSTARVAYIRPGFETMKRCYDKYSASRLLTAAGFTCPQTELGINAERIDFPVVAKPRWGSDSIGVRLYAQGPVPAGKRNERHIVQRYIRGAEITIGPSERPRRAHRFTSERTPSGENRYDADLGTSLVPA